METRLAKEAGRRLVKGFLYLLLFAGAALYLFPFFWMISTSLKSPTEIMVQPPVWFPKDPQWSNYKEALTYFPFWRYLANTLFLVAMNMIASLVSSSLVGYAFARLKWPGRDIWFKVLLSTMMLPATVTMIPQFIMFKQFGWLNSYLPLIVPAFAGTATNIFLMRQFMRTIPTSLSDCARLDGCSEFRIFLQIILPLCKPALATVAIFSFMGTWNDFMGPLLYINDKMMYTLSYGLRTFQINLLRTIYYMPNVVSVIAVSMLWYFIFQNNYGLLNTALRTIGIQGPNWLTDPNTAKIALIIMNCWNAGGSMIIYLAGLQGIPRHYYEAAELDGAGPVRKFFSITLPLLSPSIFYNLIISIVGAFQTFSSALVMTGGGPVYSTTFYVLTLYRRAFDDNRMGYACAMAWVLLIVTMGITMLVYNTLGKKVYYESES